MLSMMENVAKVLFQGVASRTLREKYEEITSPVYIGECIHMIVDVLWPGGKVSVCPEFTCSLAIAGSFCLSLLLSVHINAGSSMSS